MRIASPGEKADGPPDAAEAMRASFHARRDRIVRGLNAIPGITCATPGGAFYAFPKVPRGTATEFTAKAIEHNLLVIPGHIFGRRDTHFRISYAVDDAVIHRGIAALNELASSLEG